MSSDEVNNQNDSQQPGSVDELCSLTIAASTRGHCVNNCLRDDGNLSIM